MKVKIITISLIFFSFSFSLKAQNTDLEGRWVVKKIDRILSNGEVIVDYNLDSSNNLLDASQMVVDHQANGILSGLTIYGSPLESGTWEVTANQITYNGNSFDLEIISENEFKTAMPYNFTTITGVDVESTVEKTYIRELLLPVTLQSFHVEKNRKTALLSWASATEENFSHYEIEHSADGISFNKIGQVLSTGYNSNYSYTDDDAFNESSIAYYRLKMVDEDDSFSYSQIETVRTSQDEVSV
jgi:hypothetical protein